MLTFVVPQFHSNTTSPLAPFGVVTLHPRAGWFGARDMGGMRHAQTAGYGHLPNDAMPATFLAQVSEALAATESCVLWFGGHLPFESSFGYIDRCMSMSMSMRMRNMYNMHNMDNTNMSMSMDMNMNMDMSNVHAMHPQSSCNAGIRSPG